MRTFIKIALIVLFFYLCAIDVLNYAYFQPNQIIPEYTYSSVYANQFFAYDSTDFNGYFLRCNGEPVFSYVEDPRPIEMEVKRLEGVVVAQPKQTFLVGYQLKSGYTVSCRIGLHFIDPDLSFHAFKAIYYPERYTVDSRQISRSELRNKLKQLNPGFLDK